MCVKRKLFKDLEPIGTLLDGYVSDSYFAVVANILYNFIH